MANQPSHGGPVTVPAVLVGCGGRALALHAVGHRPARFHSVQAFSWHTFAVNVLGSCLLGLVACWYAQRSADRLAGNVLLGTGFCGGLLRRRQPLLRLRGDAARRCRVIGFPQSSRIPFPTALRRSLY
jgi:hypothetical protein